MKVAVIQLKDPAVSSLPFYGLDKPTPSILEL